MCLIFVSAPSQGEALDNIEIYLAGYGMATQPLNQGLSFKRKDVSDERFMGILGWE